MIQEIVITLSSPSSYFLSAAIPDPNPSIGSIPLPHESMDPPLIQESSFSAANSSAYSLAEIWPFNNGEPGNGGLGLRIGNLGPLVDAPEVSTVTEQSGGRKRTAESSEKVSTSSATDSSNNSNGKRSKVSESSDENRKPEVEAEQSTKPKQDYIHVRARRGQATDSHSLAERARREKISERMKILQDLVPGCSKVIGKAIVLDEIINYIQSLQHQVEFLSMKLETVNSRMTVTPTIEGFPIKDLGPPPLDASTMLFGSQATREYMVQGSQQEWLHMQIGGRRAN